MIRALVHENWSEALNRVDVDVASILEPETSQAPGGGAAILPLIHENGRAVLNQPHVEAAPNLQEVDR